MGNASFLTGGGIANLQGTATLNNSTVTGNSAGEAGGGISNFGNLTLNNTLVALNTAPLSVDIEGVVTNNSSLVGVNPGFIRNPSPGLDGFYATADDDFGDLRLSLVLQ